MIATPGRYAIQIHFHYYYYYYYYIYYYSIWHSFVCTLCSGPISVFTTWATV